MRRLIQAISAAILIGLPGSGLWAQTNCSDSSDTCAGTHSSLFAIGHDHNDPSEILYRVSVAEQATGSDWGDGVNGFFYQIQTTAGQWQNIVPFNGIGNSADGVPMLRAFSFIQPMPEESDPLTIRACATNYTTADEGETDCTQVLWTDAYASLPKPTVGSDRSAPASLPSGFDLEFVSTNVVMRNNGVYGAHVILKPVVGNAATSLTQDQIDWLYDHIVFVDDSYNVFDNNLFPPEGAKTAAFGALTIKEAGVPEKTGSTGYLVKYSSSNTPVEPTAPGSNALLHFWLYSTDTVVSEQVQIGAGWLYDASSDCPGALSGDTNSRAASCSAAAPEAGPLPFANVTLVSGADVKTESNKSQTAGFASTRKITLSVEDSQSMCTNAVNPLAAYSSDGINLPNYLVGTELASSSWTNGFPTALYYVTPSGFGNCDASKVPFCELTDSYAAYVPHYLDTTGNGGTLNGGSTANRLVSGFDVADQYALSGLVSGSGASENAVIWFDDCGYGHEFTDSDLGSRIKSLPKPPFDRSAYSYAINSASTQSLVLTKDCCASFYQEQPNSCSSNDLADDPTGCIYDPPQQIGREYGLFLGPKQKQSYDTLFGLEAFTVYDAANGTELFQLVMGDQVEPVIHSCTGAEKASVSFDHSSSPPSLTLYPDGGGDVSCTGQSACPVGLTEGATVVNGQVYTQCTAIESTFVMGLDLWRESQAIASQPGITLSAWGGSGHQGSQGTSGGDLGGNGGSSGFAQTVIAPADIPDAFYLYVGEEGQQNDAGGASTILSKIPLSSEGQTYWEDASNINNGEIYLIAAGGGGGGYGSGKNTWDKKYQGGFGGAGGSAVATTDSAVNSPGAIGHDHGTEYTGGIGGSNGTGGGGHPAGANGIGGWVPSTTHWQANGALVPPSSWSAGNGGVASGAGGAGFGGGGGGGGGGSGQSWGHGGGGGGSWAAGVSGSTSWRIHGEMGNSPAYTGGSTSNGGFILSLGSPTDCLTSNVCTPKGKLKLITEGGDGVNCLFAGQGGVLMQNEKSMLEFTTEGELVLSNRFGEQLWAATSVGSQGKMCYWGDASHITLYNSAGTGVWYSPAGDFLVLSQCTLKIIDSSGAVTWTINQNSKCS